MPPPPLVLHVMLSLNPGGAERLVIDLCRHVRQRGRFDVAVCCLDERGEWADALAATGIEVLELRRAPGFQVSLVRDLAVRARAAGAAVLHCHQYTPFVYGVLAARLCGVPVVYTEHGRLGDEPPALKRRVANRVLGRFPFRGYAVSAELRDELVATGFPARKLGVIHNGVSVTPREALIPRRVARFELGLPQDAFVVGTIARLNPVKSLATLIDAMACLPVPAHVAIVGDGPDRASLERRAADAGIRATFTGALRDARRVLPAFDVFANTSITEGISVTILEAMDAGIPIVAARVGGTPEILEHARTGHLVTPRSPEAVAAAIARLAANPTERKALAANARIVLESRFSMASMAAQYMAAYEAVRTGRPLRDVA